MTEISKNSASSFFLAEKAKSSARLELIRAFSCFFPDARLGPSAQCVMLTTKMALHSSVSIFPSILTSISHSAISVLDCGDIFFMFSRANVWSSKVTSK